MAIAVGAAAPDFVLKDQSQKEVKLADFRGKRVVLVFYPLDWSPVCTNEHVCLVNDLKRFEQLDAQVLGLSVDSVWSHKAFAEKMGIHYPLLADFQPRGAVADKFGVYLSDKGITGRAIAIIDRAGNIAWFKQYDIPDGPGRERSRRSPRQGELIANFRGKPIGRARFALFRIRRRARLRKRPDIIDQHPALIFR
jgi:peroxiredoxin